MPTRLLLAIALVSLVPEPARAADLRAASRIDAVTVYRASARITRLVRVDAAAGDLRVILDGLPAGLDDESIRVEGKGTARAHVAGVSVELVSRADGAQPLVRAAEDRLESLLADDKAAQDRAAQARTRAKFVESLHASYSEERAKNLAVRGVSAKEWSDLSDWVGRELAAAAAEQRKVEAERRELARKINAARADLAKLEAKRNETTKQVAIEASVERAGALELAVSYLIGGAGWQPSWDARLAPETGAVELSLLGEVSQRTGEDWADARLSVSTAEPGRGLLVPVLEPRWLERLVAVPRVARNVPASAPAPAMMKLQRAEPKKEGAARADEEADALAEAPLEQQSAAATMGLLATTWTAPRRETVDGGGRVRTVPLARYALKGRVTRLVSPRADATAYLAATVQNDTGLLLLPGLARISVGDEFVGRAPLALTPPGGELKLAFGADPRIEVERKLVERRHETAGVISKDEVWVYQVRTIVKNRYAAPTTVELLDLVPVSRDEAIKVKVLDPTTAGSKADPERPGVMRWELKLAPGETRVVELRYEVRFPRDFPIQGLE